MWENKIWCVSKAVFLSKNRIWCNNTLPLFGLNMSFLCLKIHQYYSSIMQQIHYRLCTTNPWENSLNILANRQLFMKRNQLCMSCIYNSCLEDILNFLQQMAQRHQTWLKREFDCVTFSPACVGVIYLTWSCNVISIIFNVMENDGQWFSLFVFTNKVLMHCIMYLEPGLLSYNQSPFHPSALWWALLYVQTDQS